jgi:hypothetical protein
MDTQLLQHSNPIPFCLCISLLTFYFQLLTHCVAAIAAAVPCAAAAKTSLFTERLP